MVYYTLISLLVQVLVITSERFDLLLTDDLLYFSTPNSVKLNALTMAMVIVVILVRVYHYHALHLV